MKFLTVDVTKEDIRVGQISTQDMLDKDHHYTRGNQCPLALAIRRVIPTAEVGRDTWVYATAMPSNNATELQHLLGHSGEWFKFKLSKRALKFVHTADHLHNKRNPTKGLKPERFRLRYE